MTNFARGKQYFSRVANRASIPSARSCTSRSSRAAGIRWGRKLLASSSLGIEARRRAGVAWALGRSGRRAAVGRSRCVLVARARGHEVLRVRPALARPVRPPRRTVQVRRADHICHIGQRAVGCPPASRARCRRRPPRGRPAGAGLSAQSVSAAGGIHKLRAAQFNRPGGKELLKICPAEAKTPSSVCLPVSVCR